MDLCGTPVLGEEAIFPVSRLWFVGQGNFPCGNIDLVLLSFRQVIEEKREEEIARMFLVGIRKKFDSGKKKKKC